MRPSLRTLLLCSLLWFGNYTRCWAAYAAIAYSPSTGSFGYSYECDSQYQAERIAISKCSGSDARVEVWVSNGWVALACNDRGQWGTGWSTDSRAGAEMHALKGVPDGRILCWAFSGDD